MARFITIVLLAIIIGLGSHWQGTAQENETLEERVATLEQQVETLEERVAILEQQAIAPALGIRFGPNGWDDISALNDPNQMAFSVCRQVDLLPHLSEQGFGSLPELNQTPMGRQIANVAAGGTGADIEYIEIGCARAP